VTLMTAMAKVLTRNTRPAHADAPVSCFTTIYPAMFGATAGARDSTLMGVPTMMHERGVNPFIGVTFAVDDGHQHLSLRAYAKACLMLRRQPAFDGSRSVVEPPVRRYRYWPQGGCSPVLA
jgi:hypothetical protein